VTREASFLRLLGLYTAPYSHNPLFFAGLAAYAYARLFETGDRAVLAWDGIVSGSTLQHPLAAGGMACVAVMRSSPEGVAGS
jgi:hypothetical protein